MDQDNLTEEQRAVVESRVARLTVRAAAGSGKTRTLAARYLKHITQDKLTPDQILTITYTRKAAAEMKTRIVRELLEAGLRNDAQTAETGPIQTIHGFCERLLRENSVTAGIDPRFEVMDVGLVSEITGVAFLEVLEEIGEESQVNELIRLRTAERAYQGEGALQESLYEDVVNVLNQLRGADVNPEQLAQIYAEPAALSEAMRFAGTAHIVPEDENLRHSCGLMKIVLRVWQCLEEEMNKRQSFDFSELERRALALVTDSPATREKLQRQYLVALVDEAQDLNPKQYKLLGELGIKTEMLVGDPQQSIFGFRQADYQRFVERSQETDTIHLGGNFRSGRLILDFVDTIFAKWWKDYDPMSAMTDFDGEVELWDAAAYSRECTAQMVRRAVDQGFKPGEIAVLVQTSAQAKDIPGELEKLGIQSRIVGGGVSYFGRMHVRDLANLLDVLVRPESDLALLALLRSPVVGISLDGIVKLANAHRESRRAMGWRLSEDADLDEDDAERLEQFLSWYDPLQKYADRLAAWEALAEVFRLSPYLERIAHQPNGRQALANARKLLELAIEDRELGPAEFAERIRMIQKSKDNEGDAPAVDDDECTVKIMTIWKAKGLEFPVVVVADPYRRRKGLGGVLVDQDTGLVFTKYLNAESEAYAHFKSVKRERDHQESERVLYVAMTRAKRRLVLGVSSGTQGTFASEIAKFASVGASNCRWTVIPFSPVDSGPQDQQANANAPEDP